MPTYGSRVAYSLTCTRLNQSGSANNASSIYMNIYIYIYMYINHRYRYSCVSCIIYICMYVCISIIDIDTPVLVVSSRRMMLYNESTEPRTPQPIRDLPPDKHSSLACCTY
jgi:hypothetical protein